MLNKVNPLNVKQTYQRCQEGEQDACQSLLLSGASFDLGGPTVQTNPTPYSAVSGMAEGGGVEESLLSPAPMEEEVTDPFLALQEVLGDEAYGELQSAMVDYPVVQVLAEMAVQTSDGFVEGMGGPKDDMVPARLSHGEYVFSTEAVESLGLDKLEELHEYGKQLAASS